MQAFNKEKTTDFRNACVKGDRNVLAQLIDDPEVSVAILSSKEYQNPVIMALQANHLEVVSFLAEHPRTSNKLCFYGSLEYGYPKKLLDLACEKGAIELVKVLTKRLSSLQIEFVYAHNETSRTISELLREHNALTELNLFGSFVDERAMLIMSALHTNNTLTSLKFSHSRIGYATARVIADVLKKNSTLSSLYLEQNDEMPTNGVKLITDALKINKALTYLQLSQSRISDNGAKAIAEMLKENQSLSCLDISDNQIGPEGIQAIADSLKTNKILKFLDLSSNILTTEGAQILAEVLENNQTLLSLNLRGADIGLDGLRALISSLKINKSLVNLDLCSNYLIGDEGVTDLAAALESNKTIKSLVIVNIGIGDAGIRLLAQALKINKTLSTLNLSSNHFGFEGVGALAELLKINRILTNLDLGYNNIGDSGVEVLLNALESNDTLTSLELSSINIGILGLKAISKLLKTNNTLTFLGLGSNKIQYEGWIELWSALKENKTLKSLDLTGNLIEIAAATELKKMLEINNSLTALNIHNYNHAIEEKVQEELEKAFRFNISLTSLKIHYWSGNRYSSVPFYLDRNRKIAEYIKQIHDFITDSTKKVIPTIASDYNHYSFWGEEVEISLIRKLVSKALLSTLLDSDRELDIGKLNALREYNNIVHDFASSVLEKVDEFKAIYLSKLNELLVKYHASYIKEKNIWENITSKLQQISSSPLTIRDILHDHDMIIHLGLHKNERFLELLKKDEFYFGSLLRDNCRTDQDLYSLTTKRLLELLQIEDLYFLQLLQDSQQAKITANKQGVSKKKVLDILLKDKLYFAGLCEDIQSASKEDKCTNIERLLELLQKDRSYFGTILNGMQSTNEETQGQAKAALLNLLQTNELYSDMLLKDIHSTVEKAQGISLTEMIQNLVATLFCSNHSVEHTEAPFTYNTNNKALYNIVRQDIPTTLELLNSRENIIEQWRLDEWEETHKLHRSVENLGED